ncbi:hypothetical protein F443_09250 [Phytophthora nicotianae P1569]|uniref:Uncharacterized protein n=1 Tax=Phytophthora nicotianae P1569 TaxID=1317065 RepID=V9F5M1_PHYNI|nr:hypothetical protein F443_09250 [Phytophthora nicotianae P1569]
MPLHLRIATWPTSYGCALFTSFKWLSIYRFIVTKPQSKTIGVVDHNATWPISMIVTEIRFQGMVNHTIQRLLDLIWFMSSKHLDVVASDVIAFP